MCNGLTVNFSAPEAERLHSALSCRRTVAHWSRELKGATVMENWSKIKGWENYEISDFGNIRRKLRPVKTFIVKGYLGFNVSNGKLRKSLRVHREVARSFLKDFKDDLLVRHWDGNPLNCKLLNLSMGTHVQNEDDKRRHGTLMEGEKHHQSKLSNDDVLFIRNSGLGSFFLGRKFKVTPGTIWSIRSKNTWRHI